MWRHVNLERLSAFRSKPERNFIAQIQREIIELFARQFDIEELSVFESHREHCHRAC